jgi:hypothetical protein
MPKNIEKKSCFIIMPFTNVMFKEKNLDKVELGYIYNDIIKQAVSEYMADPCWS